MPDKTPPNTDRLRSALEAYFTAIAARDTERIASVFAVDGELEDPVGGPIRRGRDQIAAQFAAGVAVLASHVKIEVLVALPSGSSIAAHWAMTARGRGGREVGAEGIDVLQVNEGGQIVRAEGYWDAAGFRRALAAA